MEPPQFIATCSVHPVEERDFSDVTSLLRPNLEVEVVGFSGT